jgi:flagellar biosynthesis protein FliQ
MEVAVILSVLKEAFYIAFLVASPVLLVALVVGVLISVFQAATSISDSTLSFAPKVIAAGVVLMLTLPWGLGKLVGLMTRLLERIPQLVD